MVVNLARTRVTHPGGTIPAARFVFHNGRAAVWVEDKLTKTATRVLFATDVEFRKPNSARYPMQVLLSDGTEWLVKQERGGCGCGSPLKRIALSTLLDPQVDTV